MVASLKEECSFSNWYHVFEKISLEAEIVEIPSDVMKYLEHDAFLLPIEATRNATSAETEWSDGTAVDPDASEVGIIINQKLKFQNIFHSKSHL